VGNQSSSFIFIIKSKEKPQPIPKCPQQLALTFKFFKNIGLNFNLRLAKNFGVFLGPNLDQLGVFLKVQLGLIWGLMNPSCV
jgi:hypothetical protein